jgi:hypothetical protein
MVVPIGNARKRALTSHLSMTAVCVNETDDRKPEDCGLLSPGRRKSRNDVVLRRLDERRTSGGRLRLLKTSAGEANGAHRR